MGPHEEFPFQNIRKQIPLLNLFPITAVENQHHHFLSAFVRPVVMRRNNRQVSVRPLSESVDYNPDLVEKLEGPTLQKVLSRGPEERFKRSSLR